MSVEYAILKVDPREYKIWFDSIDLDALGDAEYDEAIARRQELSSSVNDRLYEPELHEHVANAVVEIVEGVEKDGGTEDASAGAFREFARTIYWSFFSDAKGPNELRLNSENLELSLGEKGLRELSDGLAGVDPESLSQLCQERGIRLEELEELVDGGLAGLVARWRTVAQECLDEGKGLVVEVFG